MVLPKKLLSRKEEITRDFLHLLDAHIDDVMNEKISHMFHTSQFAELLFIHPRHLTNTIKLTTGKSPCELIEDLILKEAQKMLMDTDLSVTEISYRLTYSEPTNFVKFYKSMTGVTPLQYRKTLREKSPVIL